MSDTSTAPPAQPAPPPFDPDPAERGARDARSSDRLFLQLLAYTNCHDEPAVVQAVTSAVTHSRGDAASAASNAPLDAVVYRNVNDPLGIAVLTLTPDPSALAGPIRDLLRQPPFTELTPRPDLTMIGRTYSIGYEHDLPETLQHRPRRHALDPACPWAVWYPLRRSGAFARLPRPEQMDILKEHGTLGMAYGRARLAQDIRLASHGLDAHDNDFTIGLLGPDLAPLSKLVETMRGTIQTSQYLTNLGPFFVGHVLYQSSNTHVPPPPARH
ncbi:MAG: chlorite dismutase family protein [Planctomycetota bacterium]